MNSVNLVGRLTRDPEGKLTGGGTPVVNFSLAVDGWDSAAKEAKADFIRCTAYGKQAEFLTQYGSKGRQASVEGRLSVRSWEDRDGNKRETTEVIVNRVNLLGPKPENNGGGKPAPAEEQEDFSLF